MKRGLSMRRQSVLLLSATILALGSAGVASAARGTAAGTPGWNYARKSCGKVTKQCKTLLCCTNCCAAKYRDDAIELSNCNAYCNAVPW